MSGDVFGNGMLLSRSPSRRRFDHRDIFMSIQDLTRTAPSRNDAACSRCRARAGPITTRR
jgi:NAD-specific glutamate dehydrogenase